MPATAGASTPNDAVPDLDTDSPLVDYADETWGVVLNHRLQNAESLVDFRYALASGYLVKRSGLGDSDGLVALSLSLIYHPTTTPTTTMTSNHAKIYEAALREALHHYRGLVTLAQHLGVVDVTKAVTPWHIAAATKAQEALSFLL